MPNTGLPAQKLDEKVYGETTEDKPNCEKCHVFQTSVNA